MILKNKDIIEEKKSLKESKKFHYGEEIIKFLDKYGYNKRGESFEEYRDYSTVTYMYAIPQGMRPQTPYVEFTVDADNDAFIFGEFFTDGRKGYSTEFDSVEDLEYFISNANYSNVDLTEKKSATKSIKERYEYKVDEITDIIRSNGVLFDSCNILDDYAWNIEHGKTTWLSKHAYDEISIAYANCIQYLKDEYNGKKKDELIDDLTKFFDKVISLTESNKSVKKSLKEGIDVKIVYADDTPSEYIDDVTHNDILDIIEESPEVYKIFDVSGSKKKLVWSDEYGFERAYESKKSARKSLKEGINDELIATSSDAKANLYLSDERQANHGKDPHYEFSLAENGYFTEYVRCDDEDCEKVVLDWIKEFDFDISKAEILKMIKLYESKKSVKKSDKTKYEIIDKIHEIDPNMMIDPVEWTVDELELFLLKLQRKSAKKSLKKRDNTIFSKDVKRWMLSGNDINITFKDGNELVGAIYEHRKDSEDKKAECFLCEDLTADYTGDYFIVEVYNGKIYEIKFQSYDWLEHYMNESYDLMESKKSARKSMKEQFVGKGEGGYRKPRANKNNSGVCKDSNGVNHKVIFDTHVEDFIVWVDNDNYLMWDIYSAGGLKRNLLKSDLDEKLIDEIAELGKQLIYGFDTDF